MQRLIILLALSLKFYTPGFGQPSKTEVLRELENISSNYSIPNNLSFDLQYRYANEVDPQKWVDSLRGKYYVTAEGIFFAVDNTETIVNKDYTIVLFKNDNLMYVTKSMLNQANPVAMLDTLILSNVTNCQVLRTNKETIIELIFPDGSSCKRIQYLIDPPSQRVLRITQIVKADQLLDESVRSPEKSTEYAIVQIDFSNYSDAVKVSDIFKPEHYFKRNGEILSCVPPFESFRIFVGTPNL
jgi:hypothetical protein